VRKTDIDPDSLNRPDGNSLLDNYGLHDVGEAYFTELMECTGLIVEEWGIDERHNNEGLIFDNKMDLRLWEGMDDQTEVPPVEGIEDVVTTQWELDGHVEGKEWQLRGVADVKTKSSPSWFGRFNVRHLAHYAEWADRYDVPVFVYMTMVDGEEGVVCDDEFIVPITTDWDFQTIADNYDSDHQTDLTYGEIKDICRECDIADRVFRAPDGNLVFDITDDQKKTVEDLLERL